MFNKNNPYDVNYPHPENISSMKLTEDLWSEIWDFEPECLENWENIIAGLQHLIYRCETRIKEEKF